MKGNVAVSMMMKILLAVLALVAGASILLLLQQAEVPSLL